MTDILSVGIRSAPVGLCLNPAVPEARAAWYSFGYLVRRAAATQMDVNEDELNLGIEPILDFRVPFAPPSARLFLSDSLDNGAGYCTHLGDPKRFEELLTIRPTPVSVASSGHFWSRTIDGRRYSRVTAA